MSSVPSNPVPSNPVPAKMTPQSAASLIQGEVANTLTSLNQSATGPQLDMFMQQIGGIISTAISSGDATTLKYARDQIIAHLARVSLGALHQEQVAVANTVITVISVLLKLAVI